MALDINGYNSAFRDVLAFAPRRRTANNMSANHLGRQRILAVPRLMADLSPVNLPLTDCKTAQTLA